MIMLIHAVTISEGMSVDNIRETLDIHYYCSALCMVEHLAADGMEVNTVMSGKIEGDPVTYTDGTPTGDVRVIEYGPVSWDLPDYTVICTNPSCEEMINEVPETD